MKIADGLVKDFGSSAYSDQANLAAARVQAENQQFDLAAARLREVMQHTRDDTLALIARARLARVQLAQGKPDEAIKTLDARGCRCVQGALRRAARRCVACQG